jgi:hypothetical protein
MVRHVSWTVGSPFDRLLITQMISHEEQNLASIPPDEWRQRNCTVISYIHAWLSRQEYELKVLGAGCLRACLDLTDRKQEKVGDYYLMKGSLDCSTMTIGATLLRMSVTIYRSTRRNMLEDLDVQHIRIYARTVHQNVIFLYADTV